MIRTRRVHSRDDDLPLLLDRWHAKPARFPQLVKFAGSREGIMLCIALAIIALGLTGCMTPAVNPNDSRVNDPSHIRVRAGSILAPIEYDSTKNVTGKAKYNPDSGAFEVEINTDAASVNETLVAMQREIGEHYKTYVAQIRELTEQQRVISATITSVAMNVAQVATSLTNIPGAVISGLTGKPFTPNAPPVLQQQPALDEATLRRIIREELTEALRTAGP